MLNVVMLNVVAPYLDPASREKDLSITPMGLTYSKFDQLGLSLTFVRETFELGHCKAIKFLLKANGLAYLS